MVEKKQGGQQWRGTRRTPGKIKAGMETTTMHSGHGGNKQKKIGTEGIEAGRF